MARPELEVPRDHLVVQGDRGIAVGDRFVPTDANGRQLINHYGPAGTFPTFSMQDLVRGAIEPAALAGRVVLVGVSAAGAGDLFATPYMSRLPGSEFLATTIDHILAGRPVPGPQRCARASGHRRGRCQSRRIRSTGRTRSPGCRMAAPDGQHRDPSRPGADGRPRRCDPVSVHRGRRYGQRGAQAGDAHPPARH